MTSLISKFQIFIKLPKPLKLNFQHKATIDLSNYPKLNEDDLTEDFVRGSGPGGQSVNKTANAVVLKHIPTGFVVKCHKTRSVSENRKEARRLMLIKLDNSVNGELSVENQTKSYSSKKMSETNRRQKKNDEMKRKFKERENLD